MIKRIGHNTFSTQGHDAVPVSIESVDKFKGGFNEVLSYLPLSDQVHNGKKQERFMRGLVGCECRPTFTVFICPQAGKAFEVFINSHSNTYFEILPVIVLYGPIINYKRPGLGNIIVF